MELSHHALSLLAPPDSGFTWVGSIVLLVVSVRLLLLPLGWAQLRAGQRTTALRPRLAALQREHAADRAGYLAAARELQRSEGAGAAGCLPVLVQLPVFLGLYHLLAGFGVTAGTGGNGVFSATQVHGFAHATVAGVPLAAAVRSSAVVLGELRSGLSVPDVLAVVLPLLLVAAGAALVNGLGAARRQARTGGEEPLPGLGSATRAMVWLAPASILAGGLLFPVPLALVLYWAVNGTWTTAQTTLLLRRLDRRPATSPG